MPANTDGPLNTCTIAALLAALLIMTSLLYFKGLTPSFCADDYVHLDKDIRYGDLWEAREVFFHLDGREYRPLVRLSMWINHKMGTTALAFHITNLLLHLACIVCLYFLFFKLSGSQLGALAGCTLFALHPIHTTNVDFIMGRTGMLCTLICFLALLVFLEAAQRRSVLLRVASLGIFIIALLAKEEAIALPVLMLFITLLHPDRRLRKTVKQASLELAPFFIILLIYLAFRFISLSGNLSQIAVYTGFSPIHILKNYIEWAAGLIYPFDLYQARWAVETGQFTAIWVPMGIVALLAAGLIYIFWPHRAALLKNRLMILSLIWFIVTLLPISGGNAHRWYLYMPSAGMGLFVVAIQRQELTVLRKRLLTGMASIVLVCYAIGIYEQSGIWSQQSRIEADIIEQAGALRLNTLDGFYFVNMPFGFKSAFLFTFSSFENALAIRYGKRPKIRILSYLNLDSDTRISVSNVARRLTFSMQPTPSAYFIFPRLQRRFSSRNVLFTMDCFQIKITQIAAGGTVASYNMELLGQPKWPVYYFDGRKIHKVALETPLVFGS
jgi:protein O-mannosyl-transferase